jgi:hypothetical protein
VLDPGRTEATITASGTLLEAPKQLHLLPSIAVTVTAVIVTSCTQRKAGRDRVDVAQLPECAALVRLAQAWRRAIGKASSDTAAQSLYQGRSIVDAAAAAAALDAPWYVVSAGLGLIRYDQPVPAYECTVAVGTDLDRRLRALERSAAQWWNALTDTSPAPLSKLIAKAPTLLALPSGYLRLVHDDLAQVTPANARSLRIFTSAAGAQCLPNHLQGCVMPYDDRLESVRGYAGTQSDFAQRALRHFVEVLQATDRPLEEAHEAVATSLASRRRRQRSMGQRMTDDEILKVLEAEWSRHSGSSTRLLRYLRDEARISCEQKRFSRLWQGLTAQMRVSR